MQVKNYPNVWMYHFIKPEGNNDFPYLNKISLEHFRKHLDHIQDNYQVLSPEEFYYYLKRGSFPKSCSLLTFDDGLADHYIYVLPELEKRGLKGIFFVPTLPLIKKKFIDIHKIHCIYGRKGYEWFMEEFKKKLFENEVSVKKIFFHDPRACTAYPYDNIDIARFKYGVNYLLPTKIVSCIVDQVFSSLFDEKELFKTFYLSLNHLRELQDKEMAIGLHGHSHRPFSNLSDEELFEEMISSSSFFKEQLNIEHCFLSFPYGDETSVNQRNLVIIQQFKIKCAFFAEDSCNQTLYQLSRKDSMEMENLVIGLVNTSENNFS